MQRITDFIKGLAGITTSAAILVGIPVGLLIVIGWPLPSSVPDLDLVLRHITDGDVPDAFLLKVIACIVWAIWAQVATALLGEFLSIARGKAATRTPVLPGVRGFAMRLATWSTLLLSACAPLRPAAALPLQPLASPSADHRPTVQLVVEPETAEPEAIRPTAMERYVTVRGDTWWDISERLLGDGMRWNDIRSLNIGTRQPDGTTISQSTEVIKPGWALVVPIDADVRVADRVQPVGADTVTVNKGDHFWSIAEDVLAQSWGRPATDAEVAPYWAELVAVNDGSLLPPEDPNLIYPGQEFVLPEVPRSPDVAVDLSGDDVLSPPSVVLTPVDEEHVDVPGSDLPIEVVEPSVVERQALVEGSTAPVQTPKPADSEQSPSQTVTHDWRNDVAKTVASVSGATALFGGALLLTLRGLRSVQAARRRPGSVPDPAPEGASEFEQRIRSISTDGEDVRYIAAANDYLSLKLETATTPIPSVIAVRAGQFGLELLLDEPCEPVDGFHVSTDDKTAWRLNADLDVRMMEADTKGDAHPFAPGLCVVGSTDAGSLLLDLEQLGAVSLEGTPGAVGDFLRGLVASACVAPWGTECELIAFGVDGLTGDELSRLSTPSNPIDWAEETAVRMSAQAKQLDRSPYEERVGHGVVLHPTIVFVGQGTDLGGVAQRLAPVAGLAYAPLVVVAAHPLANEYRIILEQDSASLEPFGLSFMPVSLNLEELEAVDQLLANASDTSTSPPANEWANQIEEQESDAAGATTAVDSEPSAEAVEAIARILKPRPIEIRILGRHPTVIGTDGQPTPKIEAIITYLAFHREVVGQRLRDEFWPGSTSRQGCDNAISRVRSLLGSSKDGSPRLRTKRATHSYEVSDDVGLDWFRVEQLVAAAKGKSSADEAAYLDAACELIEGHVAADASPANYGWLLREPTIYTLIETTLVDAAHRRGQLALAVGDTARADWAARKGLSIVDGQEAMYRLRMEAASEAGDTDGINSAYREARRAAESYGYDEEVQPETQALFEKLTSVGRTHAQNA